MSCMVAETTGCSSRAVLEAPPDDPVGGATPNADIRAVIVAAFGAVWFPPGGPAAPDVVLVGGTVMAGTCTNGNGSCARVLNSAEYACSSHI